MVAITPVLVSIIAGAAFADALSIRQSPEPACATTCLAKAAGATSCGGLSDVDCVCRAPAFFGTFTLCAGETCGSGDITPAMQAITNLCNGHTGSLLSVTSLSVTATPVDGPTSTIPTASAVTSNTSAPTSSIPASAPTVTPKAPASASVSAPAPPATTTKTGGAASLGVNSGAAVGLALVAGAFAVL